MTLSEKQFIFSKNVASLINYLYSQGFTCSLGEAWRSQEQADLYAKEGKGIKDSLHCKRLAIDLNLFKGEQYLGDAADYKILGDYWITLHPFNRWGGSFHPLVDLDHYEMQDL